MLGSYHNSSRGISGDVPREDGRIYNKQIIHAVNLGIDVYHCCAVVDTTVVKAELTCPYASSACFKARGSVGLTYPMV